MVLADAGAFVTQAPYQVCVEREGHHYYTGISQVYTRSTFAVQIFPIDLVYRPFTPGFWTTLFCTVIALWMATTVAFMITKEVYYM